MNLARIVYPQSAIGKLLRLPLQLIPSQTVVPVIRGPLRGKKWIAGSFTHGCWLGGYEYEKQQIFLEHSRPGMVVYDMGANVGFYSLLASVSVGEGGHVYSFEPLSRNLAFLRKHLELNKVENCTVLDVCVSNLDGFVLFEQVGTAMSHISEKGLETRTRRIDSLIAEGLRPPNLIKCDIEGAELDALLGATDTLSSFHPTILLATHGAELHRQCCSLLAEIGYDLNTLDGGPIEQADEVLAVFQ